MGTVRALLAISVVFFHAYGFALVGGILAVQLFFIISGFLISYVLVEARTYGSLQSFYENRALRLFPIYFAVAFAALALHLFLYAVMGLPSPVVETYQNLNDEGRLALTLSNLGVFGQDWIMFTALDQGSFRLTTDYTDRALRSAAHPGRGLAGPSCAADAWSLGIELSFYLIAPFVLPRMRLMLYLLAAGLAGPACLAHVHGARALHRPLELSLLPNRARHVPLRRPVAPALDALRQSQGLADDNRAAIWVTRQTNGILAYFAAYANFLPLGRAAQHYDAC